MTLAATRPVLDQAAGRRTPAELAVEFKHVRLAGAVVTCLPRRRLKPKHCDGKTCVHTHAAGSRPQEIRKGRRWLAA